MYVLWTTKGNPEDGTDSPSVSVKVTKEIETDDATSLKGYSK